MRLLSAREYRVHQGRVSAIRSCRRSRAAGEHRGRRPATTRQGRPRVSRWARSKALKVAGPCAHGIRTPSGCPQGRQPERLSTIPGFTIRCLTGRGYSLTLCLRFTQSGETRFAAGQRAGSRLSQRGRRSIRSRERCCGWRPANSRVVPVDRAGNTTDTRPYVIRALARVRSRGPRRGRPGDQGHSWAGNGSGRSRAVEHHVRSSGRFRPPHRAAKPGPAPPARAASRRAARLHHEPLPPPALSISLLQDERGPIAPAPRIATVVPPCPRRGPRRCNCQGQGFVQAHPSSAPHPERGMYRAPSATANSGHCRPSRARRCRPPRGQATGCQTAPAFRSPRARQRDRV